jgi:hypothetical protein
LELVVDYRDAFEGRTMLTRGYPQRVIRVDALVVGAAATQQGRLIAVSRAPKKGARLRGGSGGNALPPWR